LAVNPPSLTQFSDVDATENPAALVGYLDAISPSDVARAYKRLTFALQDAHEGDRLLDLGCGTGQDALELARVVGENGQVVGVDKSKAMVAEARRRVARSSVPVCFIVGDAYELPFRADSFDGCRADRVFQHLDDPRRAISELVRVCRPGGGLVISEPDWETVVIDAAHRALTRRITDFLCDGFSNGWAAHQLRRLLKEAGADHVSVTPVPVVVTDLDMAEQMLELTATVDRAREAGVISTLDHNAWLEELIRANQADQFFLAFTGYVASARKP